MQVHYGYVNISREFKPPQRQDLGGFAFRRRRRLGYDYDVDNVILENIKQVTFIGFDDGLLKAGLYNVLQPIQYVVVSNGMA